MSTTAEITNPVITPGQIDLRKDKNQPKKVMYSGHEVAQKLHELTQSFIKDLSIKPYPNHVYVQHTDEFITKNIQNYEQQSGELNQSL